MTLNDDIKEEMVRDEAAEQLRAEFDTWLKGLTKAEVIAFVGEHELYDIWEDL